MSHLDKSAESRDQDKATGSGRGAEISFDYSSMGVSNSSSYVSVSSGRAPHFDGTRYAAWKHKMKMHLRSLHPFIWKIVETGFKPVDPNNLTPEEDKAQHFNDLAVNALFNALSDSEFNRVDGLDNAKEIWERLMITHEGISSVRESKIELIIGELSRFTLEDGEGYNNMFDRLMVLVNQAKGLGSTELTDKAVVKIILRVITPTNRNLVQLIRDRPNFDTLTPHDVIGRLMMDEMMIKEAEVVEELKSGKKKGIALKAVKTIQEAEASTSEDDESCGPLTNEDMALFVRRFNKFFKKKNFKLGGHSKSFGSKSRGRHSTRRCYECGEPGHFIAECPQKEEKEEKPHKKDKYRRKDKEKSKKHKGKGHAYLGKEWDSDSNSESNSDNEGGLASVAIATSMTKSKSLFDNLSDEDEEAPMCLMAKGHKVSSKVSTSSIVDNCLDEYDSDSDDENIDNVFTSMKDFDIHKLDLLLKDIETLEGVVEQKEATLEAQEDLLILEKEKNHELEKSLSLERKKNEDLVKSSKMTKSEIVSLEITNASLIEQLAQAKDACKVLELKLVDLSSNSSTITNNNSNASLASTSNGCARCFNVDVNACATNHETLKALAYDNEKLKEMLEDGLQKSYKASKGLEEYLGKRQGNFMKHGLGYVPPKGKGSHVVVAPLNKPIHFVKGEGNPKYKAHSTFFASYMLKRTNLGHVVAYRVGRKPKNAPYAQSIWVPKSLVTNVRGPKQVWVPKSKV